MIPTEAQSLVERLILVCGWTRLRPLGLTISLDDGGVVHRIEPRVAIKREKRIDSTVVNV